MSNVWRATDPQGNEEEFLSRDFDALDLADRLYLPIRVEDKTDGGKLVATIDTPEDPSGPRVEVGWAA